MAAKEQWKSTGKNTGKAFSNFGKALGKTMKTVFTDDENMLEANGHTEVSNAWRETGKAFGAAGKSFGKAMGETFGAEEKPEDKPKEEPKEEANNDNGIAQIEYKEEKTEER